MCWLSLLPLVKIRLNVLLKSGGSIHIFFFFKKQITTCIFILFDYSIFLIMYTFSKILSAVLMILVTVKHQFLFIFQKLSGYRIWILVSGMIIFWMLLPMKTKTKVNPYCKTTHYLVTILILEEFQSGMYYLFIFLQR